MDLTLRMVSPWSQVGFGPLAKAEPRMAQPFGRGNSTPVRKGHRPVGLIILDLNENRSAANFAKVICIKS
jgi:hypothetical protein